MTAVPASGGMEPVVLLLLRICGHLLACCAMRDRALDNAASTSDGVGQGDAG